MDSTARTSPLTLSLSRQFSGLMSRDEFFATLFILGCLNGLGSQVVHSVRVSGWTDALLSTFGISAIVWIACFGGVRLILRERTGIVRPPDLILGLALLLLITLPIGPLSWLAITILCLYVLLFTEPSSSRQRGALILLATTVPMLWSRLLFRYFANFILEIDASLIGFLLGTGHTGNIVRFADQSGTLVISPYCSSLANVSLALVTWVTISQWLSHRWSLKDLFWCFLAAVSVIAINVIRISLMGLSEMHYQMIHNHWGDTIANLLIVSLTVGLCLLGVKRELFRRV
jgi:exosortase/archaeosortase family protein